MCSSSPPLLYLAVNNKICAHTFVKSLSIYCASLCTFACVGDGSGRMSLPSDAAGRLLLLRLTMLLLLLLLRLLRLLLLLLIDHGKTILVLRLFGCYRQWRTNRWVCVRTDCGIRHLLAVGQRCVVLVNGYKTATVQCKTRIYKNDTFCVCV